ncbi:mechanosensitive ion channel family protein [Ruegeria sp. THAF33]|uniref:mechanosensitive ion channel family protein n=1 Tax=Ruegeria sp. THAF33 TaxID=2587853 RepID=UPI0012679BE8|nr:mechanosensitive ion channel family protein [Ruegeria sp. THAF33]QFT74908.1 Moderate conductance mechanosensitive channel YbiO precursor [Ruegeria sp. THAF33]
MAKPSTLYWWLIGLGSIVLVVAEVVFGGILLHGETKQITSTTRVLLFLLSGSLLSLAMLAALRHYLLTSNARQETTDPEHAPSSRGLSVIPLVRAILITFTVVIAILVALAELGVKIAPMLAGAGIVGIVLGMGAQSLLKDILAGIFFVIDDAFRLGEYVEIGETRGTVEKISLRSMQIRHHRGALQTLPYGTIQSVKNRSRDWVISKLEFQVPHDTDILKVKKVIKALSRQIEEDEYFGPQMLSPVKFQGIYGVDLYGLTVRVKFTTLPGEQFLIRREVYRLVQQGFANNGIEFAERTVKVDRSDDVIATADDTEAPRVSASG